MNDIDKVFMGNLDEISTEKVSKMMSDIERIKKKRSLNWDEKIMYEHLFNELKWRVA